MTQTIVKNDIVARLPKKKIFKKINIADLFDGDDLSPVGWGRVTRAGDSVQIENLSIQTNRAGVPRFEHDGAMFDYLIKEYEVPDKIQQPFQIALRQYLVHPTTGMCLNVFRLVRNGARHRIIDVADALADRHTTGACFAYELFAGGFHKASKDFMEIVYGPGWRRTFPWEILAFHTAEAIEIEENLQEYIDPTTRRELTIRQCCLPWTLQQLKTASAFWYAKVPKRYKQCGAVRSMAYCATTDELYK